ncbi:MAG: toxin [Candidatus Omnitrophota bacterium]|jgi:hypothetical protein
MDNKDVDKLDKSNTIVYTIYWSQLKSQRLKRTRGVSFEEIIQAKLLAICQHPSRKEQQILIYEYHRYVWVVPFVVSKDSIFLKTIYPSRKYRNLYMKR